MLVDEAAQRTKWCALNGYAGHVIASDDPPALRGGGISAQKTLDVVGALLLVRHERVFVLERDHLRSERRYRPERERVPEDHCAIAGELCRALAIANQGTFAAPSKTGEVVPLALGAAHVVPGERQ